MKFTVRWMRNKNLSAVNYIKIKVCVNFALLILSFLWRMCDTQRLAWMWYVRRNVSFTFAISVLGFYCAWVFVIFKSKHMHSKQYKVYDGDLGNWSWFQLRNWKASEDVHWWQIYGNRMSQPVWETVIFLGKPYSVNNIFRKQCS